MVDPVYHEIKVVFSGETWIFFHGSTLYEIQNVKKWQASFLIITWKYGYVQQKNTFQASI